MSPALEVRVGSFLHDLAKLNVSFNRKTDHRCRAKTMTGVGYVGLAHQVLLSSSFNKAVSVYFNNKVF